MAENSKKSERERRDWIIILIILLFGFLCLILAGGWAIRFAPTWKLDTNMQSNLNPNSDFLTNRPVGYYEPLDPSILTQPVWMGVYLTPGASINTRTPAPLTNTPVNTNTPLPKPPTAILPTNTPLVILPSPTNTFIYYPPPPSTNTPKPPPTKTPVTPLPSADLSITKDDGLTNVNPGDTVTYTVRVTNNGPDSVAGATLSDPAVTGLSKTAVACSLTPGQCTTATQPTVNDLESDTSGNPPFKLPTLNNGQFYEITITTNVTASSGSITNTATIKTPNGINDPTSGNDSASDTDTVSLDADLSITVTDNATSYVAGAVKLFPNVPPYAYTITVSNAGPSNVTGATVTNVFSNGNVDPASIVWICAPLSACTPSGGMGNLNASVNLNSGASVTIYLAATVISSPSGDLVNDVTVTAPVGVTDPPGNNSATDTDQLIVSNPFPDGNIDTTPNCPIPPPEPSASSCAMIIPSGTYITLQFSSPYLIVGSHSGPDLVYYEFPQDINPDPTITEPGILMDAVILQIGDGSNWYTVLNWGDGIPDTNTNISNPPGCTGEPDNCPIASSLLYNSTGVTIDVDIPSIPPGTYPYIRIFSPSAPPDTDGQVEVDAIEILP